MVHLSTYLHVECIYMKCTYKMPKKKIPDYQKKRLTEISSFIKCWRISECISQKDFSKIAETHVNTLQKFESRTNNISVLTLFSLIDATGLTISEFFDNAINN
jgi:hypothetical protein